MDADLDSNLTYHIRAEGPDQEISRLFHVDPVTGELTAVKVFDYETLNDLEPSYTFTVEALDTGGTMPPGLASVTVKIMVSMYVCLLVGLCFNVLIRIEKGAK